MEYVSNVIFYVLSIVLGSIVLIDIRVQITVFSFVNKFGVCEGVRKFKMVSVRGLEEKEGFDLCRVQKMCCWMR